MTFCSSVDRKRWSFLVYVRICACGVEFFDDDIAPPQFACEHHCGIRACSQKCYDALIDDKDHASWCSHLAAAIRIGSTTGDCDGTNYTNRKKLIRATNVFTQIEQKPTFATCALAVAEFHEVNHRLTRQSLPEPLLRQTAVLAGLDLKEWLIVKTQHLFQYSLAEDKILAGLTLIENYIAANMYKRAENTAKKLQQLVDTHYPHLSEVAEKSLRQYL